MIDLADIRHVVHLSTNVVSGCDECGNADVSSDDVAATSARRSSW